MEPNGQEEGWDEQDDVEDAWDQDEIEDPGMDREYSVDTMSKVKNYNIWTSDEIEDRQKKVIDEIVDLLALSKDDAITALKHFYWNQEKLQEAWFADEGKTREKGGLTPKEGLVSRNMDKQDLCYIGYGKLVKDKGDALKGGHFFCSDGWGDYFIEKLNEGYHCVFATCAYFGCPLSVTHSTWLKHLKGKDRARYIKFHCKLFTDDTKNMKWCPSPGCQRCIEDKSYVLTEVKCDGGNIFGFKGNQDCHRPGDCDLALKWNLKNKDESENITWMIANTKNCPKCQRPIEKNQGCNHMTCNMCKHEFGWMCMGDWKEHGSSTGGYYKCNKYETMKNDKNAMTKAEEKREQAKHELKKYMFFYERYNNHAKAGDHAKEMEQKIEILVDKLNREKYYPIAELDFLKEGLDEVIRCRKVLKWTYAFGYYLEDEKEKALFENAQEMLEKNGDRLHEYLEQDFEPFLREEELDKKPFYQYKSNLVTCYKVTKQFYENLLEGIENGLTKQ